jgi:queuine/archaeosine tRNA-ribosyltransferase
VYISLGVYVFFFAGISDMRDIPSKRTEAILVNAPLIKSRASALPYVKKMIKSAGVNQVMMDSGGFQILRMLEKNGQISFDPSRPFIFKKMEINIAPIHVVEAAKDLKPDIMVGLDYPVIKPRKHEKQEKQKEEFLAKREINLRWMIEMAELREKHCPEIELYLPIQCYNLSQFSYFERTLNKLKYDGLSLPTRNMTAEGISEFLLRFYKIGVRKAHLLGISSLQGIALAAYCARNLFERCSLDAATWIINVQHHEYVIPGSLLCVSVGRTRVVDNKERLICRCPRCRGKTYGDIISLNDKDRRRLLLFHNHYEIKRIGKELFNHATSPRSFETYLRRCAGNRTKDIDSIMRAISMIP